MNENLRQTNHISSAIKLVCIDHYASCNISIRRSPGRTYGGHVNITEIGSFTLTDGLQLHSWFRTTSTLLRRLNMQHAQVRCMVVVGGVSGGAWADGVWVTLESVVIDR